MKTSHSGVPVIVGIGASAGGLEALEDFFQNVPEDCQLAFVVVQHVDPDQKDLLPEILQRSTPMKVTQIKNHTKAESRCVYILPPDKDLSIRNGVLLLITPVEPRLHRSPIDFFFKALAKDQGECAVAVILSGMGNDGTKGIRFIKDNAGFVLAQSPETAKFDSMPCHAIKSGLVDIVAQTKQLPSRIIGHCEHKPENPPTANQPTLQDSERSPLDNIIMLLKKKTGNDFSLYKKNTLRRRIDRRMGVHNIDSFTLYLDYLKDNPNELDLLFKELLIGVTNFFRDPAIWEKLTLETIPELLISKSSVRNFRAWIPGCSSGEEAYSLAITFQETVNKLEYEETPPSLQIFATDLNVDAISYARKGHYSFDIEDTVSAELLERYFIKDETGYSVSPNIRDMVIFAKQNVISDPPFTKLDILSCRNLQIYFDVSLQKRLMKLFHYSLLDEGILILGSAETVGRNKNLFSPLDDKLPIFKRSKITNPIQSMDLPEALPSALYSDESSSTQEERIIKPLDNLQASANQLLLSQFSPAAVLINKDGDILYINGSTGKYLEPATGKANWNIHAMIQDSLSHTLETALASASQHEGMVKVAGTIILDEKTSQAVEVNAIEIKTPEELAGLFMVSFTELDLSENTASVTELDNDESLAMQLKNARKELKQVREEKKIFQEDARSSYEELQSTNEELQSTNEELTTSKEEMQSLNEELQTLNSELHSKVDDLSWINNDMINLLNSTEIATLFLDGERNIRRFTSFCKPLFRLIDSDIGRPLSDIVTELKYEELDNDISKVLKTLEFCEKQITTKNGHLYKVRIMPYRTQEDIYDGVVITLIDIEGYTK